jgi:hypothetical protein
MLADQHGSHAWPAQLRFGRSTERGMRFLKAYLRNLLLMVLVFAGVVLFLRIFYPDARGLIPLVGQVYSGLNMWPFVILALLLLASPRRRR